MAPATSQQNFESKSSEATRQRRMSSFTAKKKPNMQTFSALTPMWAGIAGQVVEGGSKYEIGV
jgi:hypothetical protein